MTARLRNTHPRLVVALVAVLLLGISLAGCGGAGQSAQSLVKDTFGSRQQINSGDINLSLSLSASGLKGLSSPVALHVSGPFQSTGQSQFPRFDLTVGILAQGHNLKAGAISTKSQFFLKLGGSSFLAPQTTRASLQQSYAQASRTASSKKSVSTFASLGIEPASWLEHPVKAGTVQMAGAQTIHITAGLDLERFLADAGKLSGAGSQLGLANEGISGLLSPSEGKALSSSLTSAHVDLYTGASDHLLRSLIISASLKSSSKTRTQLQGLRSANLRLALNFSDINKSQRILAPSNPHPMSELVSALREIGLISAPATKSETSSQATGAGESSAPAPDLYTKCVKAAGENVAALQKCVSLLGS